MNVIFVNMTETDKAGKQYWNNVWGGIEIPKAVDPEEPGFKNYVNRYFHKHYFAKWFSRIFRDGTKGKSFLEIGCGRSAWLPYFSRQFGFDICGLDYSEVGCEQEKEVLKRGGIEGRIVCADMFSPPDDMIGKFDVVLSIGVIEHYKDTANAVSVILRYVKPGGIVITNIPNMVGLVGLIQKLIDRRVYNIHVPIGSERLKILHAFPGIEVLDCSYFLNLNFGMPNINMSAPGSFLTKIKRMIMRGLWLTSILFWIFSKCFRTSESKYLSTYIMCLARKKI